MGKEITCIEKVSSRSKHRLLYIYGLIWQMQRCISTTNWIERLKRKYKRTIKIRTSIPTSKSVLFLLQVLLCKKQKQHMKEKIINGNSGNKKRKMNKTQRKERENLQTF